MPQSPSPVAKLPISPGRSSPCERSHYRGFNDVTTRWADNDVFGHVNSPTYYSYFDTAVTRWLHARGLIGLDSGPMWVVAETGCRFLAEVAFPDLLNIGLRIGRIGVSSVRWELAVFREGFPDACAEAHFVHIFVDRASRRPTPIPPGIRETLTPMLTTGD
jgi:acyl-CoA thioester hydrolase